MFVYWAELLNFSEHLSSILITLDVCIMLPLRLLFVFSLIVSLSACSTARFERMVPDRIENMSPTHRVLTVLPIRSNIKIDRSTPLEPDIFHQALMASMERSGKFKKVQAEVSQKGYRMETSVTYQKLNFESRAAIYKFATRYAFVNNRNQVIYTTDVNTKCSKTPSDHSVGAKRERAAIECAVKENIRQLLDKMYLSRHSFR